MSLELLSHYSNVHKFRLNTLIVHIKNQTLKGKIMKKAFSVIGLGLVSFLSADCPNGNCGQGYYQGQGQYYQGQGQYHQGQGQGQYYQGQGQPQGQYYQDRGQGYGQEQYRQGQYSQQPQGQYYQQPQGQYYQGGNDSRNQPNTQYQRDQYQRDQDQRNQYQRPDQERDSKDNQNVSDQDIAKSVHDLLEAGIFSKGYPNVTFSVNHGDVTLSGAVDSQDDKTKIEDNVRKIKGVRQINNQITFAGKPANRNDSNRDSDTHVRDAQKNYPQDTASTEADRVLNARIRDRISDGWFSKSFEMITLKTNNGVVTIMGVVDSNDDVKKIQDKLKDVEGIRSVNNQLSTKSKY